jgi:type II secretion system (T2SS) protein E
MNALLEDDATESIAISITGHVFPWESEEPIAFSLEGLPDSWTLPQVDLDATEIPAESLALVPRPIMEQCLVVPFRVEPDRICLAMADPSNDGIVDELSFVTGKFVERYRADRDAIARAIERAAARSSRAERPRPFRVAPSRNSSRAFASAVVVPDR